MTTKITYYYTSNVEQNIINANAQIEVNAGIPCPGTDRWAYVQKAYNQDLWFIPQPLATGWNGIPQETMIAGIIDVDLQPYNQNWFEPIPWPPQGA